MTINHSMFNKYIFSAITLKALNIKCFQNLVYTYWGGMISAQNILLNNIVQFSYHYTPFSSIHSLKLKTQMYRTHG